MDIKQTLKDINLLKKEPLCFTLDYALHEKISAHYYNPIVIDMLRKLESSSAKLSLNSIKKEIISGPWGFQLHITDYVPEYLPGSVCLLQILNLGEFGNIIKTKHDKFISKEKDEELKSSRVRKGDIIIAKTGAINRCALIEDEVNANLNQALGIIRLKKEYNQIKIIPKFIHEFLNSKYGVLQLMRIGGYRAGQSGLSLEEIGSIILLLPIEKEQLKILDEIKQLKEKAERNLKDYHKKINEIKEIVPKKLKIKLSDEPKKEEIFSYNILDGLKNRIDCYFHSTYYQDIVKKLKKSQEIKLINGRDLDIIEDRIGRKELEELKEQEFKYIEVKHTTELGTIKECKEDILFNLPTRARQIIKTNDILLPRPIGSTEQIAIVPEKHNGQLCSTGFVVIRPENYDNAILLWCILKSDLIQKQLFYLQSGSVQPEITPTNFKEKVFIPIPKEEIQKEIIKDTREEIEQAKYFFEEYKTNRQKAKQVFLDIILKS